MKKSIIYENFYEFLDLFKIQGGDFNVSDK